MLLTVGLLSQLTFAASASLNATTTIAPTSDKLLGLPTLSIPSLPKPTFSISGLSLLYITGPTTFTTEVTIGNFKF